MEVRTSDEIRGAVKGLRVALGKTQPEFARMLGRSLASIQRYETLVPPKGKALAQFEQLARESDLPEITRVLADALGAELGTPEARWRSLQAQGAARMRLGGQAELHLPEVEEGLFFLLRFLQGLDNDLPARAKIQKAIPEVERLLHIVEAINPHTTNPAARKDEGAK